MPETGGPQQERFWEGPYPTVQSLLKREKNLVAIRSGEDKEEQMNIDRRNALVEKIEKMAKGLKRGGILV